MGSNLDARFFLSVDYLHKESKRGQNQNLLPMSKRARPDGHAAGKNARKPRRESGQEEIEEQVQKKSAGDAIFAAGRFHDLGVVPALGDHIHGERVIPNCQ